MRCSYKDDFKVDYAGSLHITKGEGIDITVKKDQISSTFKMGLDSAVSHNSCQELRAASRAVTDSLNVAFDKESSSK